MTDEEWELVLGNETGNQSQSDTEKMKFLRLLSQGNITAVVEAASRNNLSAIMMLADAYAQGEYVKKDEILARKYYPAGADCGDLRAIYMAGAYFYFGTEQPKSLPDKKMAAKYLKIAADGGNAKAQILVGDMYRRGEMGMFAPKKNAVLYYEKAARQGDAEAQYALAETYIKEQGVRFDMEKAMFWLMCARVHGDNDRTWSNAATKAINMLLEEGYPGGIQNVRALEQKIMKESPKLTRNPEKKW